MLKALMEISRGSSLGPLLRRGTPSLSIMAPGFLIGLTKAFSDLPTVWDSSYLIHLLPLPLYQTHYSQTWFPVHSGHSRYIWCKTEWYVLSGVIWNSSHLPPPPPFYSSQTFFPINPLIWLILSWCMSLWEPILPWGGNYIPPSFSKDKRENFFSRWKNK